MPRDIEIHLAGAADAAPIAALSRDRIEHGLGWSWTAPRVLRSIGERNSNVAVARAPGGHPVLGFGIMKYHDDEAHLLLLAVAAETARQGVGGALLTWLEASAQVAGIGAVYLESRLANAAARAFYAGHGYREIQVLPGYYQGREAAVRLAKDLWLAPVAPG